MPVRLPATDGPRNRFTSPVPDGPQSHRPVGDPAGGVVPGVRVVTRPLRVL